MVVPESENEPEREALNVEISPLTMERPGVAESPKLVVIELVPNETFAEP